MAQRIREFDWAATPLGPVGGWSDALCNSVQLILPAGFPMIVLWGPELVQIYNDGYRVLMANKHPAGLGQPNRVCWPEVWEFNAPLLSRVQAGETITFIDMHFRNEGEGPLTDAWYTATYSPIHDRGGIAGVLVTAIDTTSRVLAERAVKEQAEQQAFLLRLTDALRALSDPVDVQEVASRMVGEHLGVDRVAYSEIEGDENVVRRDYARGVPSMVGRYPRSAFGDKISGAFSRSGMVWAENTLASPELSAAERTAFEEARIVAYLGSTLYKDGQIAAAFGLHQATPRVWTPGEIQLVEDVGQRIWLAVERARAEVALRVSEERFRQFAEASAFGLWIRQADSLVMEYVSPAVPAIYAAEPEIFQGDLT